ncbi:ABC transporter permease [Hominifimenecus sp. rT4P-3]|uniref:ABC transporter permease n=1 Tax=Hominifimenecus sp. rT4P-3 TaxID=3242979 RepID=UPI003DA5F58B
MRFFWNLQLLEGKRAFRKLPQILVGAVVLIGIVGTIAFCGQKLLYQDEASGRIPIAVVNEGESETVDMVLSFLENMETVASLCSFIRTDAAEGMAMLKEGKAAALMEIPGSLVDDIISGANTPVRVLFPKNSEVAGLLLEAVTSAGAGTLGAAQYGIYAAYDLYVRHGVESEVSGAYDDLNRIYLSAALNRTNLFQNQSASATGEWSVLQYYLASGLTLFLLLWGITYGSFLEKDSRSLARKLRAAGVGAAARSVGRWLNTFLVTVTSGTVLALVGAVVFLVWNGEWPGDLLVRLPMLLPTISCACALTVFFYQAAPTAGSGSLLIFCTSVGMMFLAGGFVPSAFLPESFERISRFLPARWMIQNVGACLTGDFVWGEAGILVGFTILFGGLTAWLIGKEVRG